MRNFKRVILLCLAVAMGLSFAACGTGSETEPTKEQRKHLQAAQHRRPQQRKVPQMHPRYRLRPLWPLKGKGLCFGRLQFPMR